jgi:hypothetical protein
LVRFANWDGITPVNWLARRNIVVNLVRLPISGGIDPDKLLADNVRVVKFARLPIEDGIGPVSNALPRNSRYVADVRFPIVVGIVPDKALLTRLSVAMCPADTVTPYHVLTAVSVFQFVLCAHPDPLVLLKRSTSVWHSDCGTPVTTVFVQSVVALAKFVNPKNKKPKHNKTATVFNPRKFPVA